MAGYGKTLYMPDDQECPKRLQVKSAIGKYAILLIGI